MAWLYLFVLPPEGESLHFRVSPFAAPAFPSGAIGRYGQKKTEHLFRFEYLSDRRPLPF
jgi:hypothetical protein